MRIELGPLSRVSIATKYLDSAKGAWYLDTEPGGVLRDRLVLHAPELRVDPPVDVEDDRLPPVDGFAPQLHVHWCLLEEIGVVILMLIHQLLCASTGTRLPCSFD